MDLKRSEFVVEKVIGRGMFSQVSKAVCPSTGQQVALKTVRLADLDPRAVKDCIKEVQLLQYLSHENIIRYIGSFQEDGFLFIVLELADWGDLARIIKYFQTKERLLPEKTIWKLFSQVTNGLDHMHSRRIMHRDIKPANVFVSSCGRVKIGDLGLSRYLSEMTLETFSLLGTPYYMSPERLQQRGYTFSSDIWSLGCLLYEMAALQPPFYAEEKNLLLLVKKIELGLRPPIPCPRYSHEMNQLVDDCLKPDPSQRPLSNSINLRAHEMNSVMIKS